MSSPPLRARVASRVVRHVGFIQRADLGAAAAASRVTTTPRVLGSRKIVDTLVAAGANVNAANQVGDVRVMWHAAPYEEKKVISPDANVNARRTRGGGWRQNDDVDHDISRGHIGDVTMTLLRGTPRPPERRDDDPDSDDLVWCSDDGVIPMMWRACSAYTEKGRRARI